jgi:glyoxylase-like metal-dependent hydrolase (beta-lactamase superfamily II)
MLFLYGCLTILKAVLSDVEEEMMTTSADTPEAPKTVGALQVIPFAHPQGCRGYLVADPASGEAMAVDVHLDLVEAMAARVEAAGWRLAYVVDTHTHADHPSGAGVLAPRFGATRIAHEKAQHRGAERHPADGEEIRLGAVPVTVRHAPGHTPDHIVLATDAAVWSGDTLLIGGVARTDFLGGDAGQLFDSLQRLLADLPAETVLYPGHDYEGRIESTIGREKGENPWLQIKDRASFVKQLTANPPPRPANMDDLLRLNREGVDIPEALPVAEAIARVRAGGAGSVIDVRTGAEVEGEHVAGSRHIPLDQVKARADEVRATPAPRLLLCGSGVRAATARKQLAALHVGGLSVVEGGIKAWAAAGGETVKGRKRMSLERQVRIVAGCIVATGTLLGLTVHRGFLALPLFVGCGLVFAGITDWCGMGLLLARMPWNRAGSGATGPAGGGTCAASAPSGACAAGKPKG